MCQEKFNQPINTSESSLIALKKCWYVFADTQCIDNHINYHNSMYTTYVCIEFVPQCHQWSASVNVENDVNLGCFVSNCLRLGKDLRKW